MFRCTHDNRAVYCNTCILDTTGYQGRINDQLHSRLDYIWKHSDSSQKKILLEAEQKFPLVSTQVLAAFKVKNDSPKEYINSVSQAVLSLAELKKDYPKAYIKFFDKTFIIYSDL